MRRIKSVYLFLGFCLLLSMGSEAWGEAWPEGWDDLGEVYYMDTSKGLLAIETEESSLLTAKRVSFYEGNKFIQKINVVGIAEFEHHSQGDQMALLLANGTNILIPQTTTSCRQKLSTIR